MSIEIDIDLSGLEKRFSDQALRQAQMEFEDKVLADCGGNVPVDTGTLKGSGHVSAPGEGEIAWDTDYAGYVYHGTRKMAGRPWFDLAAQERLGEWEEFAARAIAGD